MAKVTSFKTVDIRFPTSWGLDGSDAMSQDPDYSGAYLILETEDSNLSGQGLVFTIGCGNDLYCDATYWINSFGDVNLHRVEERTNPDDVVGQAAIAKAFAPIRIVTRERRGNRIMFKQSIRDFTYPTDKERLNA